MSFESSEGNSVFARVNKYDFHKLKIVAEEERRLSIPKKLEKIERGMEVEVLENIVSISKIKLPI